MPADWRGSTSASAPDFPLLVKFIFPNDKLSIQVHPDDVYARKHERAAGGRGKTEMWHAVSADSGAAVLIGLKPGTDKAKFTAALSDGTAEALFVSHPVHARDSFFLPAGTPHTIGPGMVLCEVQQYSDLTYRVYDYDRRDASGKLRELHVEKALAVMNFGPHTGGMTQHLALPSPSPGFARALLAACKYFSAERWDVTLPAAWQTDSAHFDLLAVLSGRGTLDGPGFRGNLLPGQCWFLPASLGAYHLIPDGPLSLLRAYLPDLAALRDELHLARHTDAVIRYAVFE